MYTTSFISQCKVTMASMKILEKVNDSKAHCDRN